MKFGIFLELNKLSSMKIIKNFYGCSKLNKVLFIIPFLLMLMTGCSKDSIEDTLGEYNKKSIEHEGIERTYHLYLPENFNRANTMPLVLALHGGGGSGLRFEEDAAAGTLSAAAEEKGVIIVAPDGIDNRWNDGRTEHFGNDRMYNDVGFISAIIDQMIEEYNVDPSRVYATGISNGGFMVIRLALDLSEKIVAIAPVTAQIQQVNEMKAPNLPVSMMFVNGTEDPLVPYDGGCIRNLFNSDECRGIVLSTQESIEKFIGYNQCTNTGATEAIIDVIPDDGTSVEITRYNGCSENSEVVLVKVFGGGHTWPKGVKLPLVGDSLGLVSEEINASELILDFFLDHSRN